MALGRSDGAPVLVVGAGPVGLTMACELARHGVACRIVDANEGPTDQSRALAIQARTLEVFEGMGIIGPFLEGGRKYYGMSAFADGRRIVHLTFDLDGLDTPYPFPICLPQDRTERILRDRLRGLGVEVERRTALSALRQDATGATATLTDSGGRAVEVRTPWLVGCDGARSAVRKALGIPFEGAEYEENFLLADVRIDWDGAVDEITIILTPGGPVLAFPFPEEGRWRLVETSADTTADADPGRVVARFQAILREHGRPEATVSDPTWTSSFRIHRRVAGRFREGRCFIAGDAAHIHSPAGGQGMNTGIQDAYNLAWKLGLAARGVAPDSLLDSYSTERRGVVAGVVRGSHLLTRMVTLRNPVARSIRDHLAMILGEFDLVARRMSLDLSELGVGYRQSPIVAEDRPGPFRPGILDALDFGAGPHPGDRVPDIPLEPPPDIDGPTRLFDVLRGTRHVLLLFEGAHDVRDPAPIEAVGALARLHAPDLDAYLVARGDVAPPGISWDGPTLRDHFGELHRRFGARGACLYLVRPDGYIGYRAMPPDPVRLQAYLGRIFA